MQWRAATQLQRLRSEHDTADDGAEERHLGEPDERDHLALDLEGYASYAREDGRGGADEVPR